MFRDRFVEGFAALHARGHVADDVAQVALAFRVALVVERGHGLHQRNTGFDHGRKLPGKENEVGFLDRPGFLARFVGGCLLLEGEHHQPPAHQAGYGVVFVEGVLDAGNDLSGGVTCLVGEGNHIMVIIFRIASIVPAPVLAFRRDLRNLPIARSSLSQMPIAQEIDQVAPGALLWHVYDRKGEGRPVLHRLENDGRNLVDRPGPSRSRRRRPFEPTARYRGSSSPTSITPGPPTNLRACLPFRSLFMRTSSAPLTSRLRRGVQTAKRRVSTGIGIDGGPAGEMALHYDQGAGTIVLGDALINFEPYGFGFLPPKYCFGRPTNAPVAGETPRLRF